MKRKSPNVLYLGDRVRVVLAVQQRPGGLYSRFETEDAEVVGLGVNVTVMAPSLGVPTDIGYDRLMSMAAGFDG